MGGGGGRGRRRLQSALVSSSVSSTVLTSARECCGALSTVLNDWRGGTARSHDNFITLGFIGLGPVFTRLRRVYRNLQYTAYWLHVVGHVLCGTRKRSSPLLSPPPPPHPTPRTSIKPQRCFHNSIHKFHSFQPI